MRVSLMNSEFYTAALRWLRGPTVLVLALWVSVGLAQDSKGISEPDLVRLVNRAMLEYQVPGMAVGIIKADEVLLSRGFGLREIGKKDRVDQDTLFKIASNSKAFTTAALATLVDEGLISWDGLVIDYIPEFRMKDPWVTAGFTVTDLLTHRSGLPGFIGDMLLWPEPNLFTRADVIHALRYFEPVSGFRSNYAYDNLLYIVAGEVIPRVTGQSWGAFVESRLMRPAGMDRCFADTIPEQEMSNLASPHGVIEDQLSIIDRSRIPSQPPISAAAGGVVCSLRDMLTWTRLQLKNGTAPNGVEVFSAEQSTEMWKPRTLRNVSERDLELNRTHFKAYGFGWRLADVHGFKEVAHTGSLSGSRSYVVLIPELELGVVLLSNGSSSAARSAVMNTIVRSYMPVEQIDWFQLINEEQKQRELKRAASAVDEKPVVRSTQACCVPELTQFVGRYRDPWFGDVTINLKDGELVFNADKSPKFSGALAHHEGSRFIVRWTDRTLEADAYILFERGKNEKVVGIVMSKLDRGDYDFEDLDLTRVE